MSETWGWGIWLIAAVLAFNLTCIPLWFLTNHLRRSAGFEQKRMTTFLFLLEKRPIWKQDRSEELRAAATALREHLARADHLGPLWGRRHTTMARLEMTRICDLYPDDSAAVLSQMERGG